MFRVDCRSTLSYAMVRKRICDSHFEAKYGRRNCADCEFTLKGFGGSTFCDKVSFLDEERIAMVQQWSDEHPCETLLQRFQKTFPNAQMNEYGVPHLCPEDIGWADTPCNNPNAQSCIDCWNRPYKET